MDAFDQAPTAENPVMRLCEEDFKGAPALQIIQHAESSLESTQWIE
jgi:hypothetical protein